MELLDYFYQVFQRTGKPIQFLDNQNIPPSEGTQALRKLRSFPELADELFLEDLLSPRFLQSVHLEIWILILGADVIFKRRLHEISGVGCTGAQHGLPNLRAMAETLAPAACGHC